MQNHIFLVHYHCEHQQSNVVGKLAPCETPIFVPFLSMVNINIIVFHYTNHLSALKIFLNVEDGVIQLANQYVTKDACELL